MKTKIAIGIGGLIVFCGLMLTGWGFPWSWEEPALKEDLDRHIEEDHKTFDDGMDRIQEQGERILNKLDQIQQIIEQRHKKK